MTDALPPPTAAAVGLIYRAESRRVFATLVRLLGDFNVAEEALHDAFRAALEQWPTQGVPANPRAWLVSAGRFRAIDALRRRARFVSAEDVPEIVAAVADEAPLPGEDAGLEDDRLRLIFTCCHPALGPDAQVALTLREVCGLATEEIAQAFLVRPAAIAQRIVRAKAKIRDARIPYQVPATDELAERLDAVLRVAYLVFNEGYSASSGERVTRLDLTAEAIRLARLVADLVPDADSEGLLALMLLQESRREARTSPNGDLVVLEAQDRSRWNRALIAEGLSRAAQAMQRPPVGGYALQAAIAAEHARAPTAAATDWARIVALYDLLAQVAPSPVVELNRAVALAMRDGPQAGLVLVEALLARGELAGYHLAHAARADLCRRLGRPVEAREAYRTALALARQGPERRFLEQRLAALGP